MIQRYSLLLLLLAFHFACQNETTYEEVRTTSETDFLATVQEVWHWIETKDSIAIFEISKAKKYEKEHLPNAINLWRPDYENNKEYAYSGMSATKEQVEALLSKYGVFPSTKIVIYDTKGSVDAIRFWWILDYYGHENIVVMDGGKTAWKQANYPLTKEISKPKIKSNYKFAPNKKGQQKASIKDVQAAINDEQTIIIDTREPEEYQGQPYISQGQLYAYKKGAYTHGCIPTAIHLNWSDAVNLDGDHRIKSIQDLKYNFEQLGITPDKKIITYCQSGVRSAHTAFVLSHILDYPNVSNYDGSWIEWSYKHKHNKEQTPIEQYTSTEDFNEIFNCLSEKLGN